jgi:histidyl-tRNA synthetase
VGVAPGIDRIALAMKRQKVTVKESKQKHVVIIPIRKEMMAKTFEIAAALREAGITCEIELMGRKVSNALADADRRDIRLAVLVGPEEEKQGAATLRYMKKREQKTVKLAELVEEIMKAK